MIKLIEIADEGRGGRGKIKAVNWNFIEQLENEAISEMKYPWRNRDCMCVCREGKWGSIL